MAANGSPHGSVMSCQSLAARAFAEPEKDMTHCSGFHRSVRFSSDSRSSTRANDAENKRETPGSISLTALTVTPVTSQGSAMSQSLPSTSPAPPLPSCRFPKLEECAHFHYERVSLGGLSIETVKLDTDLKVFHCLNSSESESPRALSSSWTEASAVRQWTLTRNRDNLLQLDDMLHRYVLEEVVRQWTLTRNRDNLLQLDDMLHRYVLEEVVRQWTLTRNRDNLLQLDDMLANFWEFLV
ncbi:hypothetical protein SFRURICE_018998 [Spodoptera frugiperda]|nr:hypothetical protein SFRURICE_018998 [Spodoptera frugiperda]